ncbi:hypothetical protein BD410DRAFT_4016 [Rickenella mellea]|uniref:Serine/threonine-protein phosphatase 1 regulatory subunit 10 n=1 Tax=Rickenella mellea TaxID=50990 RepID=A0A4V3AZG9_9AGAM|nr:hypothetical protein BD410DRAFT_4016 [Rickenella mellea]
MQPQSPPISINPMYVHFNPQQQMQQRHQHQHTLSPAVLQAPYMNTIYPAATVSTPTSASSNGQPAISPEERKRQFQESIRGLLAPSALSGASAVRAIVTQLDSFGSQEVDLPLRLEIITKIRDNAGNPFFRAWADNDSAIDIFRDWLKAGATGKDDGQWEETIMPLLHVIDRLPLTIEALKTSKLGKIIMKLMKEPPTPAIKDMASNIERKWRQLVANVSESTKKTDGHSAEDKSKKRKLADQSSKSVPPAKKVAVNSSSSTTNGPSSSSSATSKTTVKKETKVVVTAVKDAKSDSSFFSAPKPKPKLPSFKKAPIAAPTPVAAVKKEPEANIAQPNAFDPFKEALKSMAKNRTSSPTVQTPPQGAGTSATGSTSSSTGPTNNTRKKRKTVSWATEDQLEQIRVIEKAVYDDDPVDGVHTTHSIRDLERGEGAALHAHMFEEAIDWCEPQLIEIPAELDIRPRGIDSQEKNTQEEREKVSLGALYMSASGIPDSPSEPAHQIPVDEVDENAKAMLAGPDIQPLFSSATSVADLVGLLKPPAEKANGPDVTMSDPMPSLGQGIDLRGLGLDPNALSALTQQLAMGGVQFGQQPAFGGIDQSWNYGQQQQQQQQPQQQQSQQDPQPYAEYGQGGYDDEGGSRGGGGGRRDQGWAPRGSRGRGRGRGGGEGFSRKRKPCSFFAAGRCKFGDACDFSHELY